MSLPQGHPTAVAFLDESGSIASDRFFAVGCRKLPDPSTLFRSIQRLRDRKHWYDEIHFADLTRDTLPSYRGVVDVLAGDAIMRFSCFIADRSLSDPIAKFGSSANAYRKMAEQLLIGSIAPNEIVTVIADEYSTPDVNPFDGGREDRGEPPSQVSRDRVGGVGELESGGALAAGRSDDLGGCLRVPAGRWPFEWALAQGSVGRVCAAEFPRTYLSQGVRTQRVKVALSRLNGQRGIRFK